MNFSVIAMLMLATLLGLLLWAKFYVPKAKKRSLLEAEIYEEVQNNLEGQQKLSNELKVKLKEFFNNDQMTEEEMLLRIGKK